MSRRSSTPKGADEVLDGIVQTLAREAARLEERSKKQALKANDIWLLVTVGSALTKVSEQQANPFSAAFQAKLRKASDADLERLKTHVTSAQ